MADDVNLATPVGIVAADDIGSKLYQKIKIGWGPNDTWNETDTATGKPIPTQLRTSTGTAGSYGAGATDSGTLRVVLPTDQMGVLGQTTLSASVPTAPASDYVAPVYALPADFVSGAITTAMTATTTTLLLAAPGASLRNYITTIIVSNAHATVGTDVVIQDGSGGTTLLTIPAAAVYGGAVITLPTPLRQTNANTAIYCANVTTGASTKVSAVGYKAA
jgi:hypothetical protein